MLRKVIGIVFLTGIACGLAGHSLMDKAFGDPKIGGKCEKMNACKDCEIDSMGTGCVTNSTHKWKTCVPYLEEPPCSDGYTVACAGWRNFETNCTGDTDFEDPCHSLKMSCFDQIITPP